MLPLTNWEVRYALDSGEYDWYISSSQTASLVESLTSADDEILYLGCGTSTLGEQLYARNRKYVTNIDSCDAVIRTMGKRFAGLAEMQFLSLDCRLLPSDLTAGVNMVVDKALLDVLLCEVELDSAKKYLQEVRRVLKRGGWFCLVSHGQPDTRVPLLASCFGLPSSDRIGVGLVPKPQLPGLDPPAVSNYFVYTIRVE